jgi:hypothetical protein
MNQHTKDTKLIPFPTACLRCSLSVCIYIHTHTHTHTRARLYIYIYIYIYIYKHTNQSNTRSKMHYKKTKSVIQRVTSTVHSKQVIFSGHCPCSSAWETREGWLAPPVITKCTGYSLSQNRNISQWPCHSTQLTMDCLPEIHWGLRNLLCFQAV